MSEASSKRANWTGSAAWCVIAAFGTYFCMYGFRKPFTAAKFEGSPLWGLDYKAVLVSAQVLGYMLSKFIGIKLVSELTPAKRVAWLIGLIAVAEVALIAFGLVPRPWNALALIANGLPLGMVFGLVLGVLEGRRNTEALTAGLCVSFIVADGATKSLGTWLIDSKVSEDWMPAVAGAISYLPFLGFCAMLKQIPPPSAADVAERSERQPMNRSDRWTFFRRYAIGLVLLTVSYLLVTILRSVRNDFAPELWAGLGTKPDAEAFTYTEALVGFGILSAIAVAVLIRDHRAAFTYAFALSIAGANVLIAAPVLQASGWISPFWYLTIVGLGLYLPYIAVHTTIFERLIAMTRDRGNIGYLMYLADAFGYLGYVGVLMAKNLVTLKPEPAEFTALFSASCQWFGFALVGLMVPCWYVFIRHPSTQRTRDT